MVITDGFKFTADLKTPPEEAGMLEMTKASGVAIKTALQYGDPEEIWADIHTRSNEIRWYHTQEAYEHLTNKSESEGKDAVQRITEDFVNKTKTEFGSARLTETMESVVPS